MRNQLTGKRILISCGPTWVPIDAVRIISNVSTGALGQLIARDLSRAGARVTLLEGQVRQTINDKAVHVVKFSFYDELFNLIKKELKKPYDIFIHAAAVSDYKLEKEFRSKLKSAKKKLVIKLVPTQKIIDVVKKVRPDIYLVGFKLEPVLTERSAVIKSKELAKQTRCSLSIVNTASEKHYQGYIIDRAGLILAKAHNRASLSKQLAGILRKH